MNWDEVFGKRKFWLMYNELDRFEDYDEDVVVACRNQSILLPFPEKYLLTISNLPHLVNFSLTHPSNPQPIELGWFGGNFALPIFRWDEVFLMEAYLSQTTRTVNMKLLTAQEKTFLDVFLNEATTSPFTGPATEALHKIGVEYGDISYIAWAYEQEVTRIGFALGQSADGAPLLPWPTRDSALRRNQEIQQIWEQRWEPVGTPKGP